MKEYDKELAAQLKKVAFVIKATSYEQICLWEKHHNTLTLSWEEIAEGSVVVLKHVGIKRRPIVICISFAKLNGYLIAFIDDTSQLVDHAVIDKYLDENCNPKWDKGNRQARTDAMNFHHVVNHIKELTNPTYYKAILKK
jgi:hypothetical protein